MNFTNELYIYVFFLFLVSAKATKCLADSSEVVVETGPFFGGRISVEDSTVPGCFVKGNSQRYFFLKWKMKRDFLAFHLMGEASVTYIHIKIL